MKIGSFNIGELIDNVRWRRERLGLNIDGRSTRIVRTRRHGRGSWAVEAFQELDIDLMHANSVEKQRFKLVIKQMGEGLSRVAVNAEHSSLRVRRMNFAKMPERDMLEAIRWNFREHIEGSMDRYVVGFNTLDEPPVDGKIPIMAYGLASEAIDEHLKLMKSLGLKPVTLEPTASALLTTFHANDILMDDEKHVCVSFGDTMTLFSVMKNKSVLFCRPLPGINHSALVRLVMRNLNLETEDARLALERWSSGGVKVQSEEGIAEDDMMRRLQTTIGHFYSQLAVEMQRSIDAFCIMYSVDRVDMIHVCGLGIRYPGMIEHMKKTLGIETRVFNPFEKLMAPERQTEAVLEVAPLYAVAVGLAIP